MNNVDLTPVGFDGYKIASDGTVYGRQGKPLMYQYTGRGFRGVYIRVAKGKKREAKLVRIDRLIGAAFYNVSLDDETVQPVYRDGDVNNVTLDNLIFARK